jgi:hypothetical protein
MATSMVYVRIPPKQEPMLGHAKAHVYEYNLCLRMHGTLHLFCRTGHHAGRHISKFSKTDLFRHYDRLICLSATNQRAASTMKVLRNMEQGTDISHCISTQVVTSQTIHQLSKFIPRTKKSPSTPGRQGSNQDKSTTQSKAANETQIIKSEQWIILLTKE